MEAVPHHVDRDPRLLERHVPEERQISPALFRGHVYEEDLTGGRREVIDLDLQGLPQLAAHHPAIRELGIHPLHHGDRPERVLPRRGQREAVRAGIDQRIEANLALRLAEVADRDRSDDTTHPCLPGREPETETARHGRTMQYLESGIKRPHAAQRNAGSTRSANSRAGSRVSRPKNSITKSVQPRAVWRRMRSI